MCVQLVKLEVKITVKQNCGGQGPKKRNTFNNYNEPK